MAKKTIIFEETQQINSIFKAFFIMSFLIFLALTIFVDTTYFSGIIICFIFSIIALTLRLNLEIYNDRIEYKLKPLHSSNRVIPLSSIVKLDMISPSSIGIFGFKIKSTFTGTYYYLGGSKIIRIRTTNGSNLFIGTKKAKELEEIFQNELKI